MTVHVKYDEMAKERRELADVTSEGFANCVYPPPPPLDYSWLKDHIAGLLTWPNPVIAFDRVSTLFT